MSANVLVGGGTGFVGSHLIKVLKNKGYGVTIVSRMPGPDHISWNDLNNKGLPKDTSAVVNLAGQNVMDFSRRWTAGFKQNVFNSRVQSTAALAKAINTAPQKPKVFVSISGISSYKPDNKREYNEHDYMEPFDFFSKLCQHWEKAAQLEPDTAAKCRLVNVRSGVVLGRNGGMIKQLYLPFFLGLGGPIGNGKQYLPWIHIDDLVNILVFAIENPKVEGILNAVGVKPATNKEFTKAFAKALHRPALIPVPNFVFDIVLGAERAKMVTEGPIVLPKRTQELGYKFLYPSIEDACRAIVQKGT